MTTCCGGFGALKDVASDETAQHIFAEHKAELLTHFNAKEIVAEKFKTQVVNGTNYEFHGKADGKDFTIKIHKPINGATSILH